MSGLEMIGLRCSPNSRVFNNAPGKFDCKVAVARGLFATPLEP